MLRVLFMLLVITLLSSSAHATIVGGDAGSGLLPWDPSIPADQRFTVIDEVSFATLTAEALHIDDDSTPLRIVVDRLETIGPEWSYEVDVRMTSAVRDWGLIFGLSTGIHDGSRSMILAVATSAVGFVDSPSCCWVDGQSVAMDTTADYHTYRVTKNGATVELFIDAEPVPSLSIPYSSFYASSAEGLMLAATSIVGQTVFDIARYEASTGVSATSAPLATVPELLLWPNAPNPFNPSTTIQFAVPVAGPVTLDVFDLSGRRVSRLVDDVFPAGSNSVTWYGVDAQGHGVASGVYLVRLQTVAGQRTRSMTLVQ